MKKILAIISSLALTSTLPFNAVACNSSSKSGTVEYEANPGFSSDVFTAPKGYVSSNPEILVEFEFTTPLGTDFHIFAVDSKNTDALTKVTTFYQVPSNWKESQPMSKEGVTITKIKYSFSAIKTIKDPNGDGQASIEIISSSTTL